MPCRALGGRLTFEVSSSERDLRDRCALECIPGPIAFGGLLQEGTVREKIERSEGASAPRRRFLLCGGVVNVEGLMAQEICAHPRAHQREGPTEKRQAKPNAVYSGKDGESDSERKISESQPFDWEQKKKAGADRG